MTDRVRKVRRASGYQGYTSRRVRTVQVGTGLPTVAELIEELSEYWAVLLGEEDSPVEGPHALQEVADQYYARASHITAMIQAGEADGSIAKGSELTKFRTGYLRTFREVCGRSADLGSRRLTALSLQAERARLGRESAS